MNKDWYNKIITAQEIAHEYCGDVERKTAIAEAWPDGLVIPDQVTVNSWSKTVYLVFIQPTDGTEGPAHALLQAFRIPLPGFVRGMGWQDTVVARVSVQWKGWNFEIRIDGIGMAPGCSLVKKTEMIAKDSWEISCPEEATA